MNREKAELVVKALETHFKNAFQTTPDFYLSDHTYDNLPVGAWTISHEGWRGESPWPYEATLRSSVSGLPVGVFLEPLNHYSLGVFDHYEIWETRN
jgi:hypothetical protein